MYKLLFKHLRIDTLYYMNGCKDAWSDWVFGGLTDLWIYGGFNMWMNWWLDEWGLVDGFIHGLMRWLMDVLMNGWVDE